MFSWDWLVTNRLIIVHELLTFKDKINSCTCLIKTKLEQKNKYTNLSAILRFYNFIMLSRTFKHQLQQIDYLRFKLFFTFGGKFWRFFSKNLF